MRSARRCARSRRRRPARTRRASQPVGAKRDVMRLALRELQRAAPAPVDVVALPAGAPFGAIEVDVAGLHALPRLRVGLPDRRADGRSRPADAALRRGRLRAVRPVQGDLPREGDHAQAADRFPRRHRVGARAQGGGAVLLHPLRQAVRRQEHDRARRREARRQALDVQRPGAAPRGAQDVRRLPRRRDERAGFRPVRRGARRRARPRIICASGRRRTRRVGKARRTCAWAKSPARGCPRGRRVGDFAHPTSSPSPRTSPARRGPPPSRSSARASWCRACRSPGRPRTASPPSPASTRCRAS